MYYLFRSKGIGNMSVWRSRREDPSFNVPFRILINNQVHNYTNENIINIIRDIYPYGLTDEVCVSNNEFVMKSDDWNEIIARAALEAL